MPNTSIVRWVSPSSAMASSTDRIAIGSPQPVAIPGLSGQLPRAVFVRGIAAGSFEAITFRLGVLHALEAMGVRVWNTARAIERCVDKSAASLLFARAGLRTPATFVTESIEAAAAHVAAADGPLVLKPLFGSQGKGIRLIHTAADLPPGEEIGSVWYLQRYVKPADGIFRDYRLFVSGGRVVEAMARRSETWVTNVHQGAAPEGWRPPAEAAALAAAAVAAIGADFAGVDLIADGEGGHLLLEVNSMPAWKGLQSVAAGDVAEAVVGDFLAAAGLIDARAAVPLAAGGRG